MAVGAEEHRGDKKEADDKELNYFSLSPDIDSVAAGIKNYQGVVFGVVGSNPGWQGFANPRPPKPGETTWGHALYAMGYHLHDGLKCIIAKSSWCNSGVTQHHIKEDYFKSGYTFNPWTLIPKGNMAGQIKTVNIHGEEGIFIPAATQSEMDLLCAKFGKDPKVIDVTV